MFPNICVNNHLLAIFLHTLKYSKVHIFQSGEASRRYESFGRTCKNINPPNDLTAFVKTLHIPDTMTVSKHVFQAPANKPGQVPQVKRE